MKRKKSKQLKNRTLTIKLERRNILNNTTPFSTVEEYKALRTNIIFSTTTDGCKIIGVSSSKASEGKSITCLNLAITFAEAEKKVLLIDCDLRLPVMSRLLGVRAVPGLTNVLVNMNSEDKIIRRIKFDKAEIDVILSGDIPPNPSELLGSEKFTAYLQTLASDYDYIFIDTPPITVVSDAVVISKSLTGIVLVIRSGQTEQAALRSALSQLEYAGANVLGFVLNGISEKTIRKYNRYKSYGYYKYYRPPATLSADTSGEVK